MKFFRRSSVLIFLIGIPMVLFFGWISVWQAPARANDIEFNSVREAMIPLPGISPVGPAYSKSFPPHDKAKAYYNRGTASYEKGDFDSAVKYLSMSLLLEPRSSDAYFNRGLSYRRQNKIDRSVSDFSNAIKLEPNQPGYYFERCNALILKNDLLGATADCSEAIKLSPLEPESYFLRGLARMLKGDLEEAFQDAVKALQLAPDYMDAKRLLAEVLTLKNLSSR